MTARRIIHIHPQAPAKPPLGEPCNGCGICCLSEPCPIGMLISRRRHGACAALRWDGERYLCGALTARAGRLRRWLVRRWIAAGAGCDCSLEAEDKP